MSVRPTPDGAPRPAHRSRLAHVLRIGAERAASTEGLILWNDAMQRAENVCQNETLKNMLYKTDDHGNSEGLYCRDVDMEEIDQRSSVWRAGQMEEDIARGDLESLEKKLGSTANLFERMDRRVITADALQEAWPTQYQITDAYPTRINLFVMAVYHNEPDIFNYLLDYYLSNGDIQEKVQRSPPPSSGQPRDTTIKRFDIVPGQLVMGTLGKFYNALVGEWKAREKRARNETVKYADLANKWELVVEKLLRLGFDRTAAVQNAPLLAGDTHPAAQRLYTILQTPSDLHGRGDAYNP